jgi:predicted CoA-substrate-specific enzyme activase
MKYGIGIDLGSRTTKIVFFNMEAQSVDYVNVIATKVNPSDSAFDLLTIGKSELCLGKEDIGKIYTTGYGRKIVSFSDKFVSEITAHAKGISFLFPKVRTILDIGGQDSKVISIVDGRVNDFSMNDKCAAGTGRFLEKVAILLGIQVKDFAKIAKTADNKIDISSTCVVFAESEIIGYLAKTERPANILEAVHRSIAKRTKNLLSRIPLIEPVVFTGGVANNLSMVRALEKTLNITLNIPKNPSITGALGAALLASK